MVTFFEWPPSLPSFGNVKLIRGAQKVLAWIIHEVSSQKSKDALKR
jgi:hypothetical protein